MDNPRDGGTPEKKALEDASLPSHSHSTRLASEVAPFEGSFARSVADEAEYQEYRAFRVRHYPLITRLMLVENPALRYMVRQNQRHEHRMRLERRKALDGPPTARFTHCVPLKHRWFYLYDSEHRARLLERIDICKTGWFEGVRARTLRMVGWLPPAVREVRDWDRYLIEVFKPKEPEYMEKAYKAYKAEMRKRAEGVCEESYGPSIFPRQWTQALREFVDAAEAGRDRHP